MYPWRKSSSHATEIPADLRANFEELGEPVVAQIVGRPYTHSAGQTPGVPAWAGNEDARRYALFWLIDKRRREKRKVWIGWSVGWGLSLIVICIAIYNVFITKQADRPELISADAKLFTNQQALPHELVTIGWVNMGKRAALRGTATLYTVSKDGGRFYKFGYSEITNGWNSSVTTIAPGLGSTPYAQFPVDMQKFLGLFLVCTKYRDDNGHSYKQNFIFELGPHSGETTTRLDEAASSNILPTTCKA